MYLLCLIDHLKQLYLGGSLFFMCALQLGGAALPPSATNRFDRLISKMYNRCEINSYDRVERLVPVCDEETKQMSDARWIPAGKPKQIRAEGTRSILYIEDNREIGLWVKEELEQRGYEVQWLISGDGAEREVLEKDVVILDIMLPGLDGFTIGQRLKRAAPTVPILLLSARSAVEDKLAGLQFADDYVTKPFHIDELAARVEVLLRRSGSGLPKRLQLGQHIVVNMTENTVRNESTGEEIILTGKQHQILMYFLSRPNQILPKEQIFEAIWGEPYMEGDKTLMVHIRHLRKKLEQNPDAPEIVETVRGIGYRVRL